MDAILNAHRVIVCTGSGGVGKTTLAAALGLRAAQQGLRVLVLTIDPARRLASALGLSRTEGEVAVPVSGLRGTLHAAMIEPQRIFEDFIRRLSPNEAVVQSVLSNRFYRQLSTTLSGSQEFTSLVKLEQCVSSGRYDLVILDTPPAEHAADFLRAPARIMDVFQGRVLRWFMSEPGGQHFFTRLFHRGTRTLLNTLEMLTGAGFITEVSRLADSLRTLMDDINAVCRRAHELLIGPQSAFVLMTSLDQAKLQEAEEFRGDLRREGYRLRAMVVNKAYPQWFLSDPQLTELGAHTDMSEGLKGLCQDMGSYFAHRCRHHQGLRAPDGEPVLVIRVPEIEGDAYGLPGLERLAGYLRQRPRDADSREADVVSPAPEH